MNKDVNEMQKFINESIEINVLVGELYRYAGDYQIISILDDADNYMRKVTRATTRAELAQIKIDVEAQLSKIRIIKSN